jgi:hypothetical protein
MAIKVAELGRGVHTLDYHEEMTVRRLLSGLGTSSPSTPDVRVNGQEIGLDERIPDESLVTVAPKIVAG